MTRSKRSGAKDIQTVVEQGEASFVASSRQPAPTTQRFSSHRNLVDRAMEDLERERLVLITRRDHLRLQTNAVDRLFAQQLAEIDATIGMYQGGLVSLAISLD